MDWCFKARLVGKDLTRLRYCDPEDSYAPVPCQKLFKLLIAAAAGKEVSSADLVTAYLQAKGLKMLMTSFGSSSGTLSTASGCTRSSVAISMAALRLDRCGAEHLQIGWSMHLALQNARTTAVFTCSTSETTQKVQRQQLQHQKIGPVWQLELCSARHS